MNNDKTISTKRPAGDKTPMITRRIGSTTYKIHVHFSETSKETFTDKVLRLIKNDPAADTQKSYN